MGNCLKCFQSSEQHTSCSSPASPSTNTTQMPSTNMAQICQPKSNLRTAVNAFERNLYCDPYHETDELLLPRSPLRNTSTCDTKRSSFKKSIIMLNGNANNMSDIVKSVKELPEVSENTLNLLFEKYKDPHDDMILSEGIERLCYDLNYQPDEFPILVLAWCLDASQMCRFTKTEFIEGLHKMAADAVKTIRLRLEQTIEMLEADTEMFKQLYRFTFRFGLEPDQRILSLEMAICLWKLVFTVHKPYLLDNWLHFLEQHPSIRGIPKDTWNMFLNFSEQCDINNYDDTEAWPSLFDDFVDYERSHVNELAASIAVNNGSGLAHCTVGDDDNNNDESLENNQRSELNPQKYPML